MFRERDICIELNGHPNIVHFEGCFMDEKCLYFLLEFCENGTLTGLLKKQSK